MTGPDLLNLAEAIQEADLSDLIAHDDKVSLSGEFDGYEIRLVVESDPETDIKDDGDWYGQLEWTRNGDYGSVRPREFNGRAKILDREHFQSLWWQPLTDLDSAGIEATESTIRQVMRDGYYWIALELLGPPCPDCECWRRECQETIGRASLGGVDSIDNDYLIHIVQDLQSELENDLTQLAERRAEQSRQRAIENAILQGAN